MTPRALYELGAIDKTPATLVEDLGDGVIVKITQMGNYVVYRKHDLVARSFRTRTFGIVAREDSEIPYSIYNWAKTQNFKQVIFVSNRHFNAIKVERQPYVNFEDIFPAEEDSLIIAMYPFRLWLEK